MDDALSVPGEAPKPPAEADVAPPRDDRFAAGLRGFGPLGLLAILAILLTGNVFVGNMVVVPVGALLVLLWVWRSRTPWREIGYSRPGNWALTVAGGIAFGVALKFLMKAIVMPLLGADPVNRAYHFLVGNRAMLPAAVWAMINAGFAEETVLRGWAFERLGKLLGSGAGAKTFIVLMTSAWFGLDHYSVQGLGGAEQAAILGLLYGTIFAVTRRLPILMIAHAAFDLASLAIVYWNLESAVAHLVFK